MPGNGFGGQIIINGGQLNIGGGGAMRTMSVKNVNGVKEITATEDGKTVKIQDDPAQGIKIELTEKQNGKEVTKKYEAKNVEELKKKQPAGYELYKKYGGEQPGNGGRADRRSRSRPAGICIPAGNAIPAVPLRRRVPLQPLPAPAACPVRACRRATTRSFRWRPCMMKNLSARTRTTAKGRGLQERLAGVQGRVEEADRRAFQATGRSSRAVGRQVNMNKIERVSAVLAGRRPDRLPVSFWYHFGPEAVSGPKAIEAHVATSRPTISTSSKVMCDGRYPLPHRADGIIEDVADLDRLAPMRGDEDIFGRHLEVLQALVAAFCRRIVDDDHDFHKASN